MAKLPRNIALSESQGKRHLPPARSNKFGTAIAVNPRTDHAHFPAIYDHGAYVKKTPTEQSDLAAIAKAEAKRVKRRDRNSPNLGNQ
jgi:hypothetical protein